MVCFCHVYKINLFFFIRSKFLEDDWMTAREFMELSDDDQERTWWEDNNFWRGIFFGNEFLFSRCFAVPHQTKISSLFPNEVFSDEAPTKTTSLY